MIKIRHCLSRAGMSATIKDAAAAERLRQVNRDELPTRPRPSRRVFLPRVAGAVSPLIAFVASGLERWPV